MQGEGFILERNCCNDNGNTVVDGLFSVSHGYLYHNRGPSIASSGKGKLLNDRKSVRIPVGPWNLDSEWC